MIQSQFALLKTRRFWPLFVTQFLGAFNDNVYKNALVILITYRLGVGLGVRPELLVTFAAGLFILPFFLFSATAGELADKYDKARLIRVLKLAEIAIMGLGALALAVGDVLGLLGVLFLMGTQSAFFGPLKYAILPDHLARDELMGGNALIEAATFLAILLGTVIGGVVVLRSGGIMAVAALCIALAVLGYGASRVIPATTPAAATLRVSRNFAAATGRIVREAARVPSVLVAMLGISWFWFLGATFLAQFPNLAKGVLGADESVVVLFLVLFAVGIAAGSLMCNLLLKGRISARLMPWAALLMAGVSLDLLFAFSAAARGSGAFVDAGTFLATFPGWRVVIDLVLLAAAGGVFVVPLYAILQTAPEAGERSRVIAALNVLNSAFMVASALASTLLLAAGVGVPLLLAGVGVLTLPVGVLLSRAL